MTTLSVVLLARDEEQMLPGCLRRLGFADEVVVLVDDRTVDDTAEEIRNLIDLAPAVYRLPIRNVFQGHVMTAGGWTREAPMRLLPRGGGDYVRQVHERLTVKSGLPVRRTQSALTHLSHRTIIENVVKTSRYAPAQASARHDDTRPVTPRILMWTFARELLRRLVRRRGYRDGVPGWAEALHQAYTLAVVDVLVWEQQQQPGIPEIYADYDA